MASETDAFKPGFGEHHGTGSENPAPGMSFDFEQGFSARLSANTLCQTLGTQASHVSARQKET